MTDILLQHGGNYITADRNGLELTLTYSFEPKRHEVYTLRNLRSYSEMKDELNNIYEEGGCTLEAFDCVVETIQTVDFHDEYFTDDGGFGYCDPRDREEIADYCAEAADKVWLMRTRPCDDRPDIEAGRQAAVKRILATYNDIPEDGYSDWECGYWNGIMGALRWVLGDEKNFLDT